MLPAVCALQLLIGWAQMMAADFLPATICSPPGAGPLCYEVNDSP